MRHEPELVSPALDPCPPLGPSMAQHSPGASFLLPAAHSLSLAPWLTCSFPLSPHQSVEIASTGPCCCTHSGSASYPHSRSSCNSGSDLPYLVPAESEAFCLAAKELGSRDCHLAQVTGLTNSKLYPMLMLFYLSGFWSEATVF